MIEIMDIKYYSSQEVADKLELKISTIRRYIKERILTSVKIGRGYFITEQMLSDFVNKERANVSSLHDVPERIPSKVTNLDDYVPTDFIKNLKKPYIVTIQDDSMSPTLVKGDKLIIDVDVPVMQNDICVVLYNSEFRVKRFHLYDFSVYLKSDNESYEPIKIAENDDFHVLGKAISVLRSLGGS